MEGIAGRGVEVEGEGERGLRAFNMMSVKRRAKTASSGVKETMSRTFVKSVKLNMQRR